MMQLNIQGNVMGRQHQELQAAEEACRVAEEACRVAEAAHRTAEEELDFSRRRQQELLAELAHLKAARQSEIAVMVQQSS
jgi:membrane protein involved in colicin uptake